MYKPQNALVFLLWPKNHGVIEEYIKQHGPKHLVTFQPYMSESIYALVDRHECRLTIIEEIPNLGAEAEKAATALYRGLIKQTELHLADQTKRERNATTVLSDKASQFLAYFALSILGLDQVASESPVELMLVNEDWMGLSKTATNWAKLHHIPILHVLHNSIFMAPCTILREQNSDAYAVLGNLDKDALGGAAHNISKITLTGLPQYDKIREESGRKVFWKKTIADWHSLDVTRPIIVYGTTWFAGITAFDDPEQPTKVLTAYFDTIKKLGNTAQHIIKDRPATGGQNEAAVRALAKQLGVPDSAYIYVTDPPLTQGITIEKSLPYVVGADVVVGADSGLTLEALVAGTQSINIVNGHAFLFGPSFPTDIGTIESKFEDLADQISQCLIAPRTPSKEALQHINASLERKNSTQKIVDLIVATALKNPQCIEQIGAVEERASKHPPEKQFIWQQFLDVAENDATGYHDNARGDLIEALDFVPRTALDIGCGTGATGAYLKRKHPATKVWGIEINKSAAAIAATRIDHVIPNKFEDIDPEQYGIQKNSLDLILCADVLEHLYNPWEVLSKLKDYLSNRGRIVISIPNIRYLPLMDDLARGYWRYAEFGVLDITHLRFFTLKELKRFVFETGYEFEKLSYGFDPTLKPMFDAYRKKLPCTVETGKISLKNVDEEELCELFSAQFFVTIKKGTPKLEHYESPHMGCFFWKGRESNYPRFLAEHRITPHEASLFDKHFAELPSTPTFELFMVCAQEASDQLPTTIQSVANQLYQNVRLSILGMNETPAALQGNKRIRWIQTGRDFWPALQRALNQSEADWAMILNAGDQLVPHALLYISEYIIRHKNVGVIYVDEDQLDSAGQAEAPYFKPDFLPDYFIEHDYLGDGALIKTALIKQTGGLETGYGLPLRHLQLKIYDCLSAAGFGHIPDVLYHRYSKRSLVYRSGEDDDGKAALGDYYKRLGKPVKIESGALPGSHRVTLQVAGTPKIHWIVDEVDALEHAKQLIETNYLQRSYANLLLTVFVADTTAQDVSAYLNTVDQANIPGLQIFIAPANQSKIQLIDLAVREIEADYILVLRADAHPASSDWLQNLLSDAQVEEIGVVAPRLIDREGSLIGNAMALGTGGLAYGFGHGSSHSDPGHFGRQLVKQNPSAVSSDAMLFSKQHYIQHEGFDLSLGDTAAAIDFCLRLGKAGLRHLWTPHTSVICNQRALPKISTDDENLLLNRWLPTIARDPFYNINLSRVAPFALLDKPQISKLRLPWKPLPRVMAFPADIMGCGHYRVIEPFNAAIKAGIVDGYLGYEHYNQYDLSIFEADTLFMQRQITDGQIDFLRTYRKLFKLKLVYELDDLITNLPTENIHKKDIPKDIATRIRTGLDLCDRFIVSTEPLADAYRHLISDIRVVPNRLDIEKWGSLKPQRRISGKPRVGWAGGLSHTGDLALIESIIKELANEVDWIFFGMCPDSARPYIKEFHVGVPTPEYPAKLASLNLDLALAPIAHNHFNECKSNLKLLEYGILGYPVIASDFGPYRCNFPVELVKNRPRDWVKAIRDHLDNLDETAKRGDALRERILTDWILQNNIDDWRSAWFDF